MRPRSVAPVHAFAELALHALAFIPYPPHDPSSLADPRYRDHVTHAFPRAAWDALDEDAPALGALYARSFAHARDHAWSVHLLPLLHDSLDAFTRTAARPASALGDSDVRDAAVLTALCTHVPDLFELLRADMALLAPAWRGVHSAIITPALDRACAQLDPLFTECASIVPSLGARGVQLSYTLGVHGRGLDRSVVVGAPLEWNALEPERVAVLAMHEASVMDARDRGAARYRDVEWIALRSLAVSVRASGHSALVHAHERWLAALQWDGLLDELVRANVIAQSLAERLKREPEARARVLAE